MVTLAKPWQQKAKIDLICPLLAHALEIQSPGLWSRGGPNAPKPHRDMHLLRVGLARLMPVSAFDSEQRATGRSPTSSTTKAFPASCKQIGGAARAQSIARWLKADQPWTKGQLSHRTSRRARTHARALSSAGSTRCASGSACFASLSPRNWWPRFRWLATWSEVAGHPGDLCAKLRGREGGSCARMLASFPNFNRLSLLEQTRWGRRRAYLSWTAEVKKARHWVAGAGAKFAVAGERTK